jgi:hypothetical protein
MIDAVKGTASAETESPLYRPDSGAPRWSGRALWAALTLVCCGDVLLSSLPATVPRPGLELVAVLFCARRYRSADAYALAFSLALLDTLLEPHWAGGLALLYLGLAWVAGSELRNRRWTGLLVVAGGSAVFDLTLVGVTHPGNWLLSWLLLELIERQIPAPHRSNAYGGPWGWA